MPGPGLAEAVGSPHPLHDWSKTFPARFFENGRVEEEEGRGGGGPLLQDRGQFGPRQNMLLRASDTFSQNSTSTTVPLSGTKNILCVGFKVDFLCPDSFCRSSQCTPQFL